MKRINIYISEEIEILLKDLGKKQGRNFAELVRESIVDLLKKYDTNL